MLHSERIEYIDFLKTIGLIGIILAHVNPPDIIKMIRSFDVPLMVIISAILAEKSYKKRIQYSVSIKAYYISRIKRLVFPTWIFLTIYFIAYAVLSGKHENLMYYIYSYGLTQYGIGYVWIILIYLYCAFLIPLYNRIPCTKINSTIILICYIIYEILYFYKIGTQNRFIMSTFYYIIPYGVLAYIGFNYNNMKISTKKIIMLISGAVFIAFLAYYWISKGTPQIVDIVKYPPRLYYLSYGVFCSSILLLLCKNMKHIHICAQRIFCYISSHSMWIYLWHILVLTIYNYLHFPSFWVVKYIAVWGGTLLIVFCVNKIMDVVGKRYNVIFLKYLRG